MIDTVANKETYAKQILSDNREFLLKAEIGTEAEINSNSAFELLGNHQIISMTLEEYAEAQDYPSMGNFCASKLTLTFYEDGVDIASYADSVIRAYCGVRTSYLYDDINAEEYEEDFEMVPLGTFYAMDVAKTEGKGKVTLTAYDKACFLEDTFAKTQAELLKEAKVNTLSVRLIIDHIVQLKGLSLANDNIPDIEIETLVTGVTYRQMLGYMAGLMGCNVRFNRENKLEFYWYEDTEYEITPEHQYYGELILNAEGERTVTSLVCTRGNWDLTKKSADPGAAIRFENPMITDVLLKTIYQERIGKIEFSGSTDGGTFIPHYIYSGELDAGDFIATYDDNLSTFILDESYIDIYYDNYLRVDGIYRITDDNLNVLTGKTVHVTGTNETRNYVEFECAILDDGTNLTFESGQTLTFCRVKQWMKNTSVSGINFTQSDDVKIMTNPADGASALQDKIVHIQHYTLNEATIVADLDGSVVLGEKNGQGIICVKEEGMVYFITSLPAELKWRGNPALEIGDIVHVISGEKSYQFYIMEQMLQMGGGIHSRIVCKGETMVK